MERCKESNLSDLEALKYDADYERVHAIFTSGYQKIANVDSGTSMIRDIMILNRLFKEVETQWVIQVKP